MPKKVKRLIAKKPKPLKAQAVSRSGNSYRTREMRADDGYVDSLVVDWKNKAE